MRPCPPPIRQVLVKVSYLRSWDPIMGRFRLSCASGCTCEAKEVSGISPEHDSQAALAGLVVTQHERCVVAVEALVSHKSKGGKAGQEGGGHAVLQVGCSAQLST